MSYQDESDFTLRNGGAYGNLRGATPIKLIPTILPCVNQGPDMFLNPGECKFFMFKSQVTFLPEQLCIPHDVAHKLKVFDISCRNTILLASSGEVSGEIFCEKRRGNMITRLHWEKVHPGEPIRVGLKGWYDRLEVLPFLKGVSQWP
jgi:hypothetical protein